MTRSATNPIPPAPDGGKEGTTTDHWSVERATRETMYAAGTAKGAATDAYFYAGAMTGNTEARPELRRQLERVKKHATNAATLARTILDREFAND